jgi:creatinine amidohydrolase/Fe(II)-dependent formamide hydrolase-like protein
MGALELDKLTWPQVKAEIDAGRDTVVVAFGATEQHGHHLPLATDALLGDHLARELAARLDAFVGPTVRLGCSAHHLGFPGTISLSQSTFSAIVADVVSSLVKGGFRRIVLVPTHGGNFAPLAAAVAELPDRGQVAALTDLGVLFAVAQIGEREYGVPLSEGGVHSGEWETSLVLAIHPELVHMDNADAGYTGDPQQVLQDLFHEGGVKELTSVGAIGDPVRATAAHGNRYWSAVVERVYENVTASPQGSARKDGAS